MLWILNYLSDVDADFRAFYHFPPNGGPGIADGNFGTFSSPRFFALAERTPMLSGVVAARAMAEEQERNGKQSQRESTREVSNNRGSSDSPWERRNAGAKRISMHQLMLIDPHLIQYGRG